ncbi:MAG: transglycosylase family protein [Candidatus Nanopelagicales bacterium]
MSPRAVFWRPAVGVVALSAALGLSLLSAPAQAAPAAARAAAPAAAAPTVTAASALPVLKRGSTGRYVRFVQRTLGVKVSGVYGARTARAVKRFQASVSLPVTGRVDLVTWKAIKRKARADAASRGATGSGADPTMTAEMKRSQSARSALAFEVWLTSTKGKSIVRRESGGRCTAVNPSGAYRGKWQMGSWFWKNYGGLKYASTPDRASCLEQDRVAYKGWVDSWWNPWGG